MSYKPEELALLITSSLSQPLFIIYCGLIPVGVTGEITHNVFFGFVEHAAPLSFSLSLLASRLFFNVCVNVSQGKGKGLRVL